MYEDLKASPLGQKLVAAGYDVIGTGGGCMSWARETKDQSLILMGQCDGVGEFDLGQNGDETAWETCVTDVDGTYLENLTIRGTLDSCIAAMAVMS